jgi:DNA-binding NarL/FixJ family response regulator
MTDCKSILLIEDHDVIRRYYADGLRQRLSDTVIIEATTGRTGIELFQRQIIDCVILDLSLPDMSGFEVLTRLVPVAAQPRVPVVVLTAIDNGPILRAAESKGAVVALQKVLTAADELATHVRRAMTAIPLDGGGSTVTPREPSVSA